MNIAIIILTPIIATLVHYEFLARLSTIVIKHRLSLVYIVIILLISHILQVLIFAYSFYILYMLDFGHLTNSSQTLADFIYFSFTTFSTLGYGDLNPMGNLRFLAGLEALLGFVLITWSASFLYFEMQKYWNKST
jgi:hypothetical protein